MTLEVRFVYNWLHPKPPAKYFGLVATKIFPWRSLYRVNFQRRGRIDSLRPNRHDSLDLGLLDMLCFHNHRRYQLRCILTILQRIVLFDCEFCSWIQAMILSLVFWMYLKISKTYFKTIFEKKYRLTNNCLKSYC